MNKIYQFDYKDERGVQLHVAGASTQEEAEKSFKKQFPKVKKYKVTEVKQDGND